MSPSTTGKPETLNTLTPYLVVNDAIAALAFYKKAFGAVEQICLKNPQDGKVIHASLKIGNSILMLCEECKEFGNFSPKSLKGTPVTIHLYVENDVDQAFKQAADAGAKVKMPLNDMFWGDRYGVLEDPFGHSWSLATNTRKLTPEEIQKAAAEMFADGNACGVAN